MCEGLWSLPSSGSLIEKVSSSCLALFLAEQAGLSNRNGQNCCSLCASSICTAREMVGGWGRGTSDSGGRTTACVQGLQSFPAVPSHDTAFHSLRLGLCSPTAILWVGSAPALHGGRLLGGGMSGGGRVVTAAGRGQAEVCEVGADPIVRVMHPRGHFGPQVTQVPTQSVRRCDGARNKKCRSSSHLGWLIQWL